MFGIRIVVYPQICPGLHVVDQLQPEGYVCVTLDSQEVAVVQSAAKQLHCNDRNVTFIARVHRLSG
jgi:hypothetical protein